MHKEAVLHNSDVYDQLDTLSMVNSPEILKEIFIETNSLLIKKEIVNICKNNKIYQLAIDTKNPRLKIEVIKAIHKELKSRWALDTEEAAENKPSKLIKSRKPKKQITAEIQVETTNQEVFPENIETVASIEVPPENIETASIAPIPEDKMILVIPEDEEASEEIVSVASAEPEQKEEEIAPTTSNKQVISQIFNLYTLVDLAKDHPEWLADIHVQINHVLESEKAIQRLEERN
jgi:hypothetical protein